MALKKSCKYQLLSNNHEKIKIMVLVIRPVPRADYISMAVMGLHYSLDDDFIIGYKVENASTVSTVN